MSSGAVSGAVLRAHGSRPVCEGAGRAVPGLQRLGVGCEGVGCWVFLEGSLNKKPRQLMIRGQAVFYGCLRFPL